MSSASLNSTPNATAKVIPLRPNSQSRRDQEFLPAAVAILETPPSPVRLAVLVSICAFAAVAIVWAYFGKIDIVAVAQGKLQPTGRVKVVQPIETGRVRQILAENGMHVRQGDVLFELDPAEALAEESGLRANLASYQAEGVRRREAIRVVRQARADQTEFSPTLPLAFPENVPASIRTREEFVLQGDLAQLGAALGAFAAQSLQKEAERHRLRETISAEQQLIATLRQRVTIRATLVEKGAGAQTALIDATETLQTQQGVLATQTGQLAEAEAGLRVIAQDMRKARGVFLAENGQKLADAERQMDDLEQRLAKARARTEHMTLRAPLAGTVQGSSVTTVGQVVMPSEELMRIVPDGSRLEIEAYLPNKDIGFVRPGQTVMIKLEAFPFTRYGSIEGAIVRVATDAIPEPDAQQIEGNPVKVSKAGGFTGGAQRTQNLVFPMSIRPDSENIAADGAIVPLSPGMAVSVEIKTGRRRILEYLFSPLVEVASEAWRER